MTDERISESAPRPPVRRAPGTLLRGALLFEVGNAAYLAAFDSATIFYHVQVVLHVAVGLLLTLLLLLRGLPAAVRSWRDPQKDGAASFVASTVAAGSVAIATALALAVTGTATPWRTLLQVHILASVLALSAGILGTLQFPH